METHAHYLPEAVLPLIHDFAGDDALGDREHALKSLADSYIASLRKPTRLAFSTITEILGDARELGFADPELNRFLHELQCLLQRH